MGGEDGGNPNDSVTTNGIDYIVPGVHRKLREYKFNSADDFYEFLLSHRSPKESTVIR